MPTTRPSVPGAVPTTTRPRAGRRRIALVLLAVFLAGQGCYNYHLTDLPSLTIGDQIRVALGEDDYARLVPGAEGSGGRRLEGRFSGLSADSVVLSVWIGQGQTGTPLASARQDVFIPREDVARVESRRFSTRSTVFLVGGIVAAMAVLFNSVGFVDIFGGGDAGTPPPPGPSPAVIGR